MKKSIGPLKLYILKVMDHIQFSYMYMVSLLYGVKIFESSGTENYLLL